MPCSNYVTTIESTTSASSQPDHLAVFCREVRNLLRSKPNCMIPFSKFVPAYHNHYGRQCCVYQFGYTKLIELLESIPHVVQIIGHDQAANSNCPDGVRVPTTASQGASSNLGGTASTATPATAAATPAASVSASTNSYGNSNINQRYITLTHREQIKRFASDLIKVVKSQPGKRLKLSQFAQAYEQVLGRTFRVLDYGTNNINVLLAEIWEGTINIIPIKREHVDEELRNEPALFVDVPLQTNKNKPVNPVLEQLVASHELVNKPYITSHYPDCWFEIPKRERSEREIKRTRYFIWDVIELLSKMKPNHSVQFSKFIPAYHYYFNRQCKVSIFGFSKLIDLFESISPDVVEIIDQGPGEEKLIQLAKRHWPMSANSGSSSGGQTLARSAQQQQAQQQQAQQRFSPTSATGNQRHQQRQSTGLSSAHPCTNTNASTSNSSSAHRHSSALSSSCASSNSNSSSSSSSPSSSAGSTAGSLAHEPIDNGPTAEEMMELEDELEAYEQLEAIKSKRSTRMSAILDIFKYPIY